MSTFDEETRLKVDSLLKEAKRLILQEYPSAEKLLSIHEFRCKPYEPERFIRGHDRKVVATSMAVKESEITHVQFCREDQQRTGKLGMKGKREHLIFIDEPSMLQRRNYDGEDFFKFGILVLLVHEVLETLITYIPLFARLNQRELNDLGTIILSAPIIESLECSSDLMEKILKFAQIDAIVKPIRELQGQTFMDSMKMTVQEQFERIRVL